MTEPKTWPHKAEWARQDSIATLDRAETELWIVVEDNQLGAMERIQKIAQVIKRVQQAKLMLKEAKS